MEENKKSAAEITDEDIEKWFGADKEEDNVVEDVTADLVRQSKALILFWHQINTEIVNAREGFKLAKAWGEEETKKKFLEQGKILFKKVEIVENELKGVLPKLRGVNFLAPDEIRLLPKWMGDAVKKE